MGGHRESLLRENPWPTLETGPVQGLFSVSSLFLAGIIPGARCDLARRAYKPAATGQSSSVQQSVPGQWSVSVQFGSAVCISPVVCIRSVPRFGRRLRRSPIFYTRSGNRRSRSGEGRIRTGTPARLQRSLGRRCRRLLSSGLRDRRRR